MPLSDFNGAGSFWKGAATLQFYWLCFAVMLAVLAHLLWPRGTDLGLGVRMRLVEHDCTLFRTVGSLARQRIGPHDSYL